MSSFASEGACTKIRLLYTTVHAFDLLSACLRVVVVVRVSITLEMYRRNKRHIPTSL